jgi:NAD(P)H dehydrogenase (quinone)
MSIVITGASGGLGRRVAELVLERDPQAGLVLVTRSPEKLADLAARGAEVRQGDFDEPASLDAAFAGGRRLLLISTDTVGVRVAQHGNAIDAAVRAGVELIAYTSILNPADDNPASLADEHRATERLLRDSGVEWTFLRNSIYADMQPASAQAALATGRLVSNSGSGRLPYVTREDCAAAAAAVLTSDGHAGQAYEITGPELLDAEALAALYAEAGGKPVSVVEVDDAAYVDGLVEHAGLPRPVAEVYASVGTATRGGHFDIASDAVERLTGRPPRTVRSILDGALAA